jgi:hypothetical protein
MGLALVAIGALLGVLMSYWFLLAVVLLDVILYGIVPLIAVCYKCGV